MILYWANYESDDIMRCAVKMVKFWIRISLEILKQSPEMLITSETKWHLLCCCHDNWHENCSFTPANLWWELTQYGNHVWSKQEPLSYFKGLKNEDIWFLAELRHQESFHGSDSVIWFLLWGAFLLDFEKNGTAIIFHVTYT